MLPKARRYKLLVRQIEDELVLYDQLTQRAHRLNRTAALVWRRCDGLTTVTETATQLETTLGVAAGQGEDLVWVALERLEKAHLLRERLVRPADRPMLSRRDAMIRLGGAAASAVLLPVVATMVAPTPAMAQSLIAARCVTNCNGTCMSGPECAKTCRSCIGTSNCACPGGYDVCCVP